MRPGARARLAVQPCCAFSCMSATVSEQLGSGSCCQLNHQGLLMVMSVMLIEGVSMSGSLHASQELQTSSAIQV